jgi:Kef-type K+ transport system membrane component KefB
VAGVALSTFPYALDVTAKVISLRDFFVTLFFVAIGMQIPLPTGSLIGWVLTFAAFVVITRAATVFIPLYLMRQGLRTSIIPALNLCQVSEFSLVVLAIGASGSSPCQPGHPRHCRARIHSPCGCFDVRHGEIR